LARVHLSASAGPDGRFLPAGESAASQHRVGFPTSVAPVTPYRVRRTSGSSDTLPVTREDHGL